MECLYSSKPFDEEGKPIRGYRTSILREWRGREMFESTKQRVCDQARPIRNNGCLSELQLEAIKRRAEDELAETAETDVGSVEEEINDVEDSISDAEGDFSEGHRTIVEQLKKNNG